MQDNSVRAGKIISKDTVISHVKQDKQKHNRQKKKNRGKSHASNSSLLKGKIQHKRQAEPQQMPIIAVKQSL